MIFLRFIYQFPGNPETGKKVDVQLARGGLRLNVGVQTLHIPDQRMKKHCCKLLVIWYKVCFPPGFNGGRYLDVTLCCCYHGGLHM